MAVPTFHFDQPFTTTGLSAGLAKLPKPLYAIVGFILFIALTLTTIGVGIVAQPVVTAMVGKDSPWLSSATIFVTFLPLWIYFLIFTVRNRRHGSGLTSRGAGLFVAGALIALVLLGLIMLFTVLFFGAHFTVNAAAFDAPSFWAVAAVSLVVFYVQGSGEEFVFRSMMPRFLGRRISTLTIVLLTSAGFSAVHFTNGLKFPMVFVYTFVLGVFFGLLVVLTNSLWAALGMHGMYNWASGYIPNIFVGGVTDPLGSTISTSIAGAIGIVVLLVLLQVRKPGWYRESVALLPGEGATARRDQPAMV